MILQAKKMTRSGGFFYTYICHSTTVVKQQINFHEKEKQLRSEKESLSFR